LLIHLKNAMLSTSLQYVLAVVAVATAASAAAPKIYLAGDSTMAATGNNDGTAGILDPCCA
jgi:uncharacterized membrane protein